MSANWRDVVLTQTERPPVGAKERVWRALHEPKLPSRGRAPGFAALALVAAAVLAFVLWPQEVTKTWATAGSVVALRDATARFDAKKNVLELTQGTVVASVWAAPPLRLMVRGRQVEVEAAELVVRVAGDTVVIAPTRGWVLVDGVTFEATDATRAQAGLEVQAIAARLPADVATRRASHRAELALEARQWETAVAALDEVGHSGALAAEAAALRKGELELRALHDPARALTTFDDVAARFPAGSLAQERELSALEAEVALRRWRDAAARARLFLANYPDSERALEVRRLLEGALLKLDDADGARKGLE